MPGIPIEPNCHGVAVVGAGYWGPNLIRNFAGSPEFDLRWVCDRDESLAERAIGPYSTVRTTACLDDVLDDPTVHAVAVATPAATHLEVAMAALEAGKHVLVEKPLASSVAEGEKLVDLAEARDLVLMCDHTYCYTPVVRRMRELVRTGRVGTIRYVDSVRINLGLVRSDVDVVWDLAPHDLSILDVLLPPDQRPIAVSALGADPLGAGHACVAYVSLPLPGDAIAHLHLNWLSPTKIRTTILGGTKRVLVWDDLQPAMRLSMYDCGVSTVPPPPGSPERERLKVSYRVGDMVAPALVETEALAAMVHEFATSMHEHRQPLTDGHSGVRVLRVLEAAERSMAQGGPLVSIDETSTPAVVSR